MKITKAGKIYGERGVVRCVGSASVFIPGERNYLINPRHPNIGKLKIGPPEPFEFDPRLLK